MKKYVKPALMALELEADATLCSGCKENANNDPYIEQLLKDFGDSFDLLFGDTELERCSMPIVEGYCKYTATATNIFDS